MLDKATGDRDTNTERNEPWSQGFWYRNQSDRARIPRETNHRVKGSGTGTRETRDTNTEKTNHKVKGSCTGTRET